MKIYVFHYAPRSHHLLKSFYYSKLNRHYVVFVTNTRERFLTSNCFQKLYLTNYIEGVGTELDLLYLQMRWLFLLAARIKQRFLSSETLTSLHSRNHQARNTLMRVYWIALNSVNIRRFSTGRRFSNISQKLHKYFSHLRYSSETILLTVFERHWWLSQSSALLFHWVTASQSVFWEKLPPKIFNPQSSRSRV